ncbi:MFS transporter [Arthrobacter psychrolactophilus]|uniref:MFS transporter n=1 Tax=Arthrobacter psychrolactophilus TaxID=92442 RepID=A0A2V5J7C4_9MICC|nr:MFS transporter [Arthrobacter psychrolactophilus]PYI38700.1 MFS transporter [Arthrobacter psychrolactophilus]
MERQHTAQTHLPAPDIDPRPLWSKVAPLASVMVIAALGTSLVNVLLPAIAGDFGVTMPAVQWVTLAFLLSSTILIVPVGRLADAAGRVRVLRVGLGVFMLASLIMSVAPGLELLIVVRAVQGAGVAAMLSLPVALVRETVAKDQMGRAMGIIGASMAFGMALGPALGGLLSASALGWHGTVFLLVPLGAMAWFLLRKVPAAYAATPQRSSVDVAGITLLALVLAGYATALTLTPGGWMGTTGLLTLVTLGLLLWVRVEKRASSPLVDLGQVRVLGIVPALALNFCGSFMMMTFTIIPPFYLTQGPGLDMGRMGLAMAVGPVVAILTGVFAGRWVDRWGSPRMTGTGLATMTVAALGFAVLVPIWGVIAFLVTAALLTAGNQMFMAGNNTAVMSRAGAAQQGTVSGMMTLARNLGFITATAVMALAFNTATTSMAGPDGAAMGMTACFGLATVMGVLAVSLSLSKRRFALIPEE